MTGNGYYYDMDAYDVDNDSYMDIFVSHSNTSQRFVFKDNNIISHPTNHFFYQTSYPNPSNFELRNSRIAIGDIDGNGLPDILFKREPNLNITKKNLLVFK